MRRLRDALFLAVAGSAVLLLVTAAAAADPSSLRPLDLHVAAGEDSWHADNDFRLDWDRPGGIAVAANLRLRDWSGSVTLFQTRFTGDVDTIGSIHIPPSPGLHTVTPGRYRADVWLESASGEVGTEASATLLFDDARPGPSRPLPPAGWVAGTAAAILRVEHPAPPQPISGIHGYAIAVDRGAEIAPCLGPSRCSPAETDLHSGIDGDAISLGLLREGTHVVSVVAVSGSGMRSAETRSAIVRVDATRPEMALRGAPQGWANGPVRLTAVATDALSGMTASGPGGPYTAISVDGGVPRLEPGDSGTAVISGEGSHRVALYARDAAGNLSEDPPPLDTIRIDESPPLVAFANSQDRADPERIEAMVSDSLSGPDPARGTVEVRPAGSRQSFAALPTVVSNGRLVARWDSEAFPPGTFEFRATAYDAAGNATTSDRRRNGARLVLANPLKAPTKVTAGFGGRRLIWQRCSRKDGQRRCRHEEIESFESRPTTRAVPYGRGVPYSGRLTSATGSPLGGLPVQVIETFDAGANSSQRTTVAQSAADGTFLTRLAPGPSRRVEVTFAGNQTLSRASGGVVGLHVLAGVRMRASSTSARIGGAPVIFRGRVGDLGAPIPAAGRPVELQFRFPGSDWSEFRTVRTDARGRFRYAYSFSDDDSRGIRFQFRAYVPAQDDWPYEPAMSSPVFVTGR